MMRLSLAATLPVERADPFRFLRTLLGTLHEARARQARAHIARHADLIASARKHRSILDARAREPGHG